MVKGWILNFCFEVIWAGSVMAAEDDGVVWQRTLSEAQNKAAAVSRSRYMRICSCIRNQPHARGVKAHSSAAFSARIAGACRSLPVDFPRTFLPARNAKVPIRRSETIADASAMDPARHGMPVASGMTPKLQTRADRARLAAITTRKEITPRRQYTRATPSATARLARYSANTWKMM